MMKRYAALWMTGAFLAGLCPAAFAAVTVDSLLDDMTDLQRLARQSDPAYTTRQFSSYDRASKSFSDYKGWFANGDAGKFLRTEDNGSRQEFVMMDTDGPGAIVRIWSANPAGTIRIYLDGNEKPAVEAAMADLLGGKAPDLPAPISCEVSRGWNLYFPIPYAKHCKVTSDKGRFYYHVNYRTYAPGTEVKTFEAGDLQRLSGRIAEVAKRLAAPRSACQMPADARKSPFEVELAPGAEAVISEQQGPSAICDLVVRLSAEDLEQAARGVVLTMAFDGEKTVESPLGDFFGTAPGLIPYESLPLGITEAADGKPQEMWCHWYMPFAKSARLTVKNLTDQKARVEGAVTAAPCTWDDKSLHFCAKWRIERDVPARPMSDWQHLEANGDGRFVGGALHIVNNVRGWWGEGDEKIYVDGETFPSHLGTGSEDYYGYAWCSPQRFVHAYHNQPRCQGPGNYGNTSVNRWHIIDDIPFTRSFRFDLENWHSNPTARTTRAAISYWYVRPGSTDFFGPIIATDVKLVPVPEFRVASAPGAVEGEKMPVLSRSGKLEVQNLGDNYSGGQQLWWTQAKPGEKIELGFEVKQAGRRRVLARCTKAGDYGIVQLYVNGQKAGEPLDLYNNRIAATPEIDLGEFDLKAGQNTLAVEIVGANKKAKKAYMFGLDYILLK